MFSCAEKYTLQNTYCALDQILHSQALPFSPQAPTNCCRATAAETKSIRSPRNGGCTHTRISQAGQGYYGWSILLEWSCTFHFILIDFSTLPFKQYHKKKHFIAKSTTICWLKDELGSWKNIFSHDNGLYEHKYNFKYFLHSRNKQNFFDNLYLPRVTNNVYHRTNMDTHHNTGDNRTMPSQDLLRKLQEKQNPVTNGHERVSKRQWRCGNIWSRRKHRHR